jgi:hypothetical protein
MREKVFVIKQLHFHLCVLSWQVVGWGLDENGKQAEKLKMVKMPVLNYNTCIWSDPDFFSKFTSNTTFCAGYRNGILSFRL